LIAIFLFREKSYRTDVEQVVKRESKQEMNLKVPNSRNQNTKHSDEDHLVEDQDEFAKKLHKKVVQGEESVRNDDNDNQKFEKFEKKQQEKTERKERIEKEKQFEEQSYNKKLEKTISRLAKINDDIITDDVFNEHNLESEVKNKFESIEDLMEKSKAKVNEKLFDKSKIKSIGEELVEQNNVKIKEEKNEIVDKKEDEIKGNRRNEKNIQKEIETEKERERGKVIAGNSIFALLSMHFLGWCLHT
jgi:hypothetical protein